MPIYLKREGRRQRNTAAATSRAWMLMGRKGYSAVSSSFFSTALPSAFIRSTTFCTAAVSAR